MADPERLLIYLVTRVWNYTEFLKNNMFFFCFVFHKECSLFSNWVQMYFLPEGTDDGALFVFFSFTFLCSFHLGHSFLFYFVFLCKVLWFEMTHWLTVSSGVFSFDIWRIAAETIKLICDYKLSRAGWGDPKSCLCWRLVKVKVYWQRQMFDWPDLLA